jgi:hypothetical protein
MTQKSGMAFLLAMPLPESLSRFSRSARIQNFYFRKAY